jgi:D-lyxose ketol-isomerase
LPPRAHAFTLRNGSPNGVPYEKCYAEKIMHVRDGQVTPMHFHWRKREDIINRRRQSDY